MKQLSNHVAWAKNFSGREDTKAAEDFDKQLTSNSAIFDTLRIILERKVEARSAVVPYDDPNWAIHTAANQGAKKAYEDILSILPKTRGD